ncbi:carboxylesterase family protein [Streptomyces noursei]|uniref:carboxylesterase family protein n=1 Tax=Streptomyces noursei TaxID=1971 RepID=UPI00381EB148
MRGLRDGSGERYRALPCAVAPTGAGRFAPPAPHPGWSGVRDGTRPSRTAPQPTRDFGRLDVAPYAGATLTGALLATPEAKGLFRRAIIQSGNGTGAFTPEQAQRVTATAAAALGVEPTAEAFAPIPDERLLAILPALAGLDLRTSTAMDPLVGLSPFSLVLPVQPADALADGPARDVDLLIGTNTEEGHLYLVPQGDLESTTEADVLAVATRVHADPETVLAAHCAARPDETPGELRSAMLGQALFESGTTRMAQAHARIAGGSTYVYSFG